MKIHPLGVTDWILELVKNDFLFVAVYLLFFCCRDLTTTLSKTNMQQHPPDNRPFFPEKEWIVFQPSNFRCYMSFREGVFDRIQVILFWLPQLEVEQKSGLAWANFIVDFWRTRFGNSIQMVVSSKKGNRSMNEKQKLAQDVVFFKPNIKSI